VRASRVQQGTETTSICNAYVRRLASARQPVRIGSIHAKTRSVKVFSERSRPGPRTKNPTFSNNDGCNKQKGLRAGPIHLKGLCSAEISPASPTLQELQFLLLLENRESVAIFHVLCRATIFWTMGTRRDRRGRTRTPFWISLALCIIASLERTAYSFSPSRRLHPCSYPPPNNHPRSSSSRFRFTSNLPGDGINSKNPSQESSESFINQHTNTTLIVVEKEDENVNLKPRTTARAPSTRTILEFAIPAIGIWLCGPLMSIIDTSGTYKVTAGASQFLQTYPNPVFIGSCGPYFGDSSTSCFKSSYCCYRLFCFLYGTKYTMPRDPFRHLSTPLSSHSLISIFFYSHFCTLEQPIL
jgi:hypothetical protein